MEFFATCGAGLEPLLGDELRRLHVHGVRPLSGGVSFSGGLEDAYRALLWSRVASRVLLTLARVDARDADALYKGARDIDWASHVPAGATIAVSARGGNDALRDTRFSALRVKDAICDELRARRGVRPDVDTQDPDVLVNVVVRREKATVSIDLSGGALGDRGYGAAGASVGSCLAAALLLAAGWGERGFTALEALGCADGTIAVEGALIAADTAPGVMRMRWGFEGWAGHDEELWDRLLSEADARAEAGHALAAPVIAHCVDARAAERIAERARHAGVADLVSCVVDDAAGAGPAAARSDALVACALLTGRGLALAQLPARFSRLSAAWRTATGSTLALLSDEEHPEAFLGAEPDARHQVRNGAHDNVLAVFAPAGEPAAAVAVRGMEVPVLDAGAGQFAARLSKVEKARRAWARDARVSAYRVYDADLPDFNFAIDVYEGVGPDEGRRCIHVAEYAPPKQIDPAKAARRLGDALRIVCAVFGVAPEAVFTKRRQRSKGGSQYAREDVASDGGRLVTQEGGLKFEVDLAGYLDTGLFLDHRMTRQLLRVLAKGKSFLNLFAYTGTASVYAAAGGAKFTTTVDLSNTYQQWARRNMELNGLLDARQEFVRADVLSWVSEMRHSKNRWDLVFVDPPTFSNSAKMGKRAWDVQRDHAELLIDVSRLLTRDGVAVFSCNLRSFAPDVEKLSRAGVKIVDITPKTIPEDFLRNPKVHHCYLLKRVEPVLH